MRVGPFDPPGARGFRDRQGIDRALPVVVALGGVLGREVGAPLVADLLGPVDRVVLEVDRLHAAESPLSTTAGHQAVGQGGDADAVGRAGRQVERDRAGLAVGGETAHAAAGRERIRAQLPETAADADLDLSDLPLESDAGAGHLAASGRDLVDSGHGLHLGAEAGRGERRQVELARAHGIELYQLWLLGPGAFDVAQHVARDAGADGPEVVLRLLGGRGAAGPLGELELDDLVVLGRGAGEMHYDGDEARLVGDDLVETGGEVLEQEVPLGVGEDLADAEIGELVGIHTRRRQRRRLPQDPPAHAGEGGFLSPSPPHRRRLRRTGTCRPSEEGQSEEQSQGCTGSHRRFPHNLRTVRLPVNGVNHRKGAISVTLFTKSASAKCHSGRGGKGSSGWLIWAHSRRALAIPGTTRWPE